MKHSQRIASVRSMMPRGWIQMSSKPRGLARGDLSLVASASIHLEMPSGLSLLEEKLALVNKVEM